MLEPRNTEVYSIQNRQEMRPYLQKAGEVIRAGGLVCFPTETVYGLGADAFNDKAVADIFHAKNRSFENPVALHLHAVEEIEKYVKKINKRTEALMAKFLPGPLMLICEKNERVSDIITGGQRKCGIRIPRHEAALEFLKECGTPVAATSANKSGRLACVNARDILEDLGGRIDVLLDDGNTPLGIESTVLDVTSDPPRIIRPGFITMEEIAVVIGIPPIFSDNIVKARYEKMDTVPKVKKILLEGDEDSIVRKVIDYINKAGDKKIGIVLTDETMARLEGLKYTYNMGPRDDPAAVAHKIFEILRNLERQEVEIILVEGIPREGLGRTLMIKLSQMSEEVVKLNEEAPSLHPAEIQVVQAADEPVPQPEEVTAPQPDEAVPDQNEEG